MDPFSAIGLAGNVIQFVDYASKVVSGAFEIYKSATGTTDENADLTRVVENVQALTQRLAYRIGQGTMTKDEASLINLVHRCQELSRELIEALKRLQMKRGNSKTESLRVALRTMRQRKNLDSMEKRVELYRKQILDLIVVMMSEETSSISKFLSDTARESAQSASQTRKQLEDLKTSTLQAVKCLKNELGSSPLPKSSGSVIDVRDKGLEQPEETMTLTLKEVKDLLTKVINTVSTITKEDWVLEKLQFPEMHNREFSIDEAHSNTFRWLLYDPLCNDTNKDSSKDQIPVSKAQTSHDTSQSNTKEGQRGERADVDTEDTVSKRGLSLGKQGSVPQMSEASANTTMPREDDKRRKTREAFVSWLNSGSGVFYISGKPGAGKSTLMKFLTSEYQTKRELEEWAGDKKLVFCPFFFWGSGTNKLQRSMEGLYRGILWETLRECPELMKDVFPRPWNSQVSPNRERLDHSTLSTAEVMEAFELLTKSDKIFKTHKVCFFIDGLDEYEGDHWRLAKSLKAWTNVGDLKVCASSRPHNEFIHTFTDADRHFRLHELTEDDIQRYVQDELEHDERFLSVIVQDERYRRLVGSVVERAEGVFLWVRLAVQELLSGIGNDYSITQLEEELSQLPVGLEALFRRMLSSIRKQDKTRAARTFLVMLSSELSFRGMQRVVAAHAVIDEFNDTGYDFKALYSKKLELPLTGDDLIRMTHIEEKRVNSRCKGFLEISRSRFMARQPELPQFAFIHRSVYEFLTMPDVESELIRLSGSFNAGKALCMAYLRLLKGSLRSTDAQVAASALLHLTNEGEDDGSPRLSDPLNNYFLSLGLFALPIIVIASTLETEEDSPCAEELKAAHEFVQHLSSCSPSTRPPNMPIVVQSMVEKLLEFSLCSLSDDLNAQNRVWMTLCALFGNKKFVLDQISTDILDPAARANVLFMASSGALHFGNLVSAVALLDHGVSPNLLFPFYSQIHPVSEAGRELIKQDWTVWKILLQLIATVVQKRQDMQDILSLDVACTLLEQYINHGADPTVVFVGYQIKPVEPEVVSSEPPTNILSGPFYFNLDQLVDIWDPANKQILLRLLGKTAHSSRWSLSSIIPTSLWRNKAEITIPHIDTERLRLSAFYTAAVMSRSDLYRAALPDIKQWTSKPEQMEWFQGIKEWQKPIWRVDL